MKIAVVLTVYFAIGGFATAYAASHAPAEKQCGYWLKYIVYLVLTAALVTIIGKWTRVLPGIVGLLVLGGFFEISKAFVPVWTRFRNGEFGVPFLPRRGFRLLFLAGFIYSMCAGLLLIFSSQATGGEATTFLNTYVLVVSFDGFSQISGQVVESRKLMPRVSPGKTVAGLVGGVAATVVTGIFLIWPEPLSGAGFGALVALAAFAGDLLASVLKRRLGIKDFSKLIPGHGGILDRFDSMLMAGAVVEGVFYLAPSIRL